MRVFMGYGSTAMPLSMRLLTSFKKLSGINPGIQHRLARLVQ